jgi:hypothetical protein
MTMLAKIQASLADFFRLDQRVDGVRVMTQCLYPSNSFVHVVIRGGEDTFYVSDEGAAVRDVEAAGAWLEKPDRLISPITNPLGLVVVGGIVRSRNVGLADLPTAIAIVANASKSVAEYLFSHLKVRPNENFKEIVASFLRQSFDDAVQSEMLVGHSNKTHKFDNVIRFPNNKKLVMDPVINDRSSINARLVANMDLRDAHYPDLEQRIVYDDRDVWQPEDLNLLQIGATLVKYSNVPQTLQRFASAQ